MIITMINDLKSHVERLEQRVVVLERELEKTKMATLEELLVDYNKTKIDNMLRGWLMMEEMGRERF